MVPGMETHGYILTSFTLSMIIRQCKEQSIFSTIVSVGRSTIVKIYSLLFLILDVLELFLE